MIGFLAGKVVHREDTQLTLLCSDIGYEINCTLNALILANDSETLELWTHLVVREDAQQLFGFADLTERSLFRELIRISGIGPKVALAILSGMDSPGLVRAIQSEDSATLTKIPGIGKKTAERLVIEMKDRLGDMPEAESVVPGSESAATSQGSLIAEAESALIALGYKPAEAARMISSLDTDAAENTETLIRQALRNKLS